MAISWVQQTLGNTAGNPSTTSAFGVNTTSGNAIVVMTFSNANNSLATSVTDSTLNPYSLIKSLANVNGSLSVYLASNITGGAGVTVSANGAANMKGLIAIEVSGLPTSSPILDQSGSSSGSSNANSIVTSISGATRDANCILIYGLLCGGSPTLTAGLLGGSTGAHFQTTIGNTIGMASEVQVVSSSGAYTGAVSSNNGGAGFMGIIVALADMVVTQPSTFNNYQFVRVGDGMSVSEKIR